jgi:hypothetical protein
VIWTLLLTGCGRPAQIGASDETMAAVDALYTAISAKRPDLLDKSAARIEELRASGELADDAYRQLKTFIDESRSGKWQDAVRKLHDFIRGQRRAQ